jgi:thymidylate synthase|tara:strand:- start:2228 stop:2941 length:714 start_codon:yes stop_codon:yes gene_type:complete
MLVRPYRVSDVRDYFISAKNNGMIGQTVDKTGVRCIELIGASFEADEPAIFGEPNIEYIQAELGWYQSQSLDINDIYGKNSGKKPPAAWQYAASDRGFVHSNYGYLTGSEDNGSQYKNCKEELIKNPNSRRAVMIYQRPSIWTEYDIDGASDFICTNSVAYYIRKDKLHCSVSMRSNDVVYGYKNDYAWQQFLLHNFAADLSASLDYEITAGKMIWQVQNLHVYEKHFGLVKPKTGL